MAKISILVNARELREGVQKLIVQVSPERALGLLRALEKIALGKCEAGAFEVGISTVRYTMGQLEVIPRTDDLLKEPVVVSVLAGADPRLLKEWHSCLFGQLFRPAEGVLKNGVKGLREPRSSAKRTGGFEALAGPDGSGRGGLAVASPAGVGSPVVQVIHPSAIEEVGGEEEGGSGPSSVITIGEKTLLTSIKDALDGLAFEGLLAVNLEVMRAMGALKAGGIVTVPKFKTKRLLGSGQRLTVEFGNDEIPVENLVRGLLSGLRFGSLTQLCVDLSTRMDKSQGTPKIESEKHRPGKPDAVRRVTH
jgi:hypothetical protein